MKCIKIEMGDDGAVMVGMCEPDDEMAEATAQPGAMMDDQSSMHPVKNLDEAMMMAKTMLMGEDQGKMMRKEVAGEVFGGQMGGGV